MDNQDNQAQQQYQDEQLDRMIAAKLNDIFELTQDLIESERALETKRAIVDALTSMGY